MKGEKVGKRKTKREKVKKALPALPLNGSLGGGFLSSEWAVAHAACGCDVRREKYAPKLRTRITQIDARLDDSQRIFFLPRITRIARILFASQGRSLFV
jgi:hypothetical protein